MMAAYPATRGGSDPLSGCVWIDLVDPTEAERAQFEKTFGLRVPTKAELAEIESTSRLRVVQNALYLSAPLIQAAEKGPWTSAPAGFVLSKHILLTVHIANAPAFDTVGKEMAAASVLDPALVFVRLLEELVDRLADLLEASSHDLDTASHVIFRGDDPRHLSRDSATLRQLMIRTGRTSERMARIHYVLVCLDRMAKFAVERGREWIAPDKVGRLQEVSSDAASLVQFVEGLVSRVQLLQDAATGIIGIGQNEVMKVLTIASVVGIPPVLVVGLYGMNFKHMPELDWTYGYPYSVILMIVSALVPLLWFKWKDWI